MSPCALRYVSSLKLVQASFSMAFTTESLPKREIPKFAQKGNTTVSLTGSQKSNVATSPGMNAVVWATVGKFEGWHFSHRGFTIRLV